MADVEWVPVELAVELSGKSLSTVRRWYQSGKVPSRMEDGRRLIDREALASLAAPAPAGVGQVSPSESSGDLHPAVQNALASFHELANRLYEAGERVGAAESQVAHLNARLDDMRKRAEEAERRLTELSRKNSRARWWRRSDSP